MKRASARPVAERREVPAGDAPPIAAALDGIRRAQFAMLDTLRRAQGDLAALRGPPRAEQAYRVIASGQHWRLRDYGGRPAAPPLLVVAAPIKRPYIWDLAPSVSAISCCRDLGLHVYLLEWLPASPPTAACGLDEYAAAIGAGAARISGKHAGRKPFLIGHSLGGTLAAIYATLAPETVRALVLLSAPLCFRPRESGFRDALVALVPTDLSQTDPVPGSLLSCVSALASPRTFVWSRLLDAARSAADRQAMEIHQLVERWALDEVALPGRLVHQIVDWLYRENRLCRGALSVGGTLLAPARLSIPVLAVVNAADEIAPRASVEPFVAAAARKAGSVIECPAEIGVALQHLGILVGRAARRDAWPRIGAWLRDRR